MRVKRLLPACLLLLACAGCGGSAGVEGKQLSSYATQGWSLVGAYERAHKEKNVEHAMALVHLGSIDVPTRDVLIHNLNEDFGKELVKAELVPLEGDETLEIVVGDRRMVPNLKVDKRLHLEFRARGTDGKPQSSTTEYFVGTLNGREMIASAQAAN
jgi:hypothetical protein